MKTLILTKNKVTIIDNEVYEWASKFKWQIVNGYVNRTKRYGPRKEGKQNHFYLHREIMNVTSEQYVDHINGNTLDNRKCNLRICTNAENCFNRGKQKNNKSGYKGVYWDKARKKWHVEIQTNGKKKHLGRFIKIKDAVNAYNEAALKYHGEFAKINE